MTGATNKKLLDIYSKIQEQMEHLAQILDDTEDGVKDAIDKIAEREGITYSQAYSRYKNTTHGGPRMLEAGTLRSALLGYEASQKQILDLVNEADEKAKLKPKKKE